MRLTVVWYQRRARNSERASLCPFRAAVIARPSATPEADAEYLQPQYVGDPRPWDAALRWARGFRQPAGPAGEAVYMQGTSGPSSSSHV